MAIANQDLTADTQSALSDLRLFAQRVGLPFRVRSARRSCATQNRLFEMGRSVPGQIVTNARGCISWHVLGRAVDITIDGGSRDDYAVLGRRWEEMGGVWGGRFSEIDDVGHFEWHPGMTIEEECPNPDACETVVAEHLAKFGASPPWAGMMVVSGLSAAAMWWWMGKK